MAQYYDETDRKDSILGDIAHKHTPDSVRQDAYRELRSRGYSDQEIKKMADEKFGDFW